MTDRTHLEPFDPDAAVFPVSVAAELAGVHPQTLRGYDRLGLVVPQRARGRGRRYSLRNVAKVRHIQYLSREEGINLEGIRRILELEDEVDSLRTQIDHLIEVVERYRTIPRSRVFTADGAGRVHDGRYVPREPREIGWR